MSRLHKHVSMISVSANAATYHDDDDDDDDDVDTAMSFMLAHELTCITTTLQRKKLISWAASYARYIWQISCFISLKEQYSRKSMLRRSKKKRKKERKQSWRIDINNLALALFMLVSMINSRHFYTDAKALKKTWLHYQLQEDNMMLWRFKSRVFKKKCNCENASHRLWMMHICKTSSRD